MHAFLVAKKERLQEKIVNYFLKYTTVINPNPKVAFYLHTNVFHSDASTSQLNMSTLTSQLQNQAQLQQFQQLRLSQSNVLNKLRRTTNATSSSEQQ